MDILSLNFAKILVVFEERVSYWYFRSHFKNRIILVSLLCNVWIICSHHNIKIPKKRKLCKQTAANSSVLEMRFSCDVTTARRGRQERELVSVQVWCFFAALWLTRWVWVSRWLFPRQNKWQPTTDILFCSQKRFILPFLWYIFSFFLLWFLSFY